jgi:hypothetical protein
MWERHDEFESTLKEVRNRPGTDIFGNVRSEIFKLREDLKRRREEPGHTGPSHGKLKTVERLVEIEHREEIMWRQHSRV